MEDVKGRSSDKGELAITRQRTLRRLRRKGSEAASGPVTGAMSYTSTRASCVPHTSSCGECAIPSVTSKVRMELAWSSNDATTSPCLMVLGFLE